MIAGLLAFTLVLGRAPGLSRLFTDPLFFKRALVVHVDLALVVWFGAFFGALFQLLPVSEPRGRRPDGTIVVAVAGVALMVGAAGVGGAEPVLANYVPVIHHPLFIAGLTLFGLGLGGSVLGRRLLPHREVENGLFRLPGSARAGLRAGGVILLAALLTFAAAALVTPRNLPPRGYYELVSWGGGHMLQVLSTVGMLSVWMVLLERATGIDPVPRPVASALFALLALPALAAPVLALRGTDNGTYNAVFTDFMRWGIFPEVVVFAGFGLRSVVRARRAGALEGHPLRHPYVAATAASMALTAAGYIIGALIRGPNTMIPAHYHAAIGAVTVAYMAVTWPLLETLGSRVPEGRLTKLVPWQPILFGSGQLVFAIGFALAGAYGLARKAYAGEQHIRTAAESVGLGIMCVGGVIAIAGGLLFLWLVARAWLAHSSRPTTERGVVTTWKNPSIRSRS